jgi:hypothetical protein
MQLGTVPAGLETSLPMSTLQKASITSAPFSTTVTETSLPASAAFCDSAGDTAGRAEDAPPRTLVKDGPCEMLGERLYVWLAGKIRPCSLPCAWS